jgi:hypothetical protein
LAHITVDHAFPLLIFAGILALLLFFLLIKYIYENYAFSSSKQEELMGIENLLNFYSSLYKSDLEYWIKEEV